MSTPTLIGRRRPDTSEHSLPDDIQAGDISREYLVEQATKRIDNLQHVMEIA